MVDDTGARVGPTLGVIQPLDGVSFPVGTFSSFLQFRVSSGGYAVIRDLVIEYQDEDNAAGIVCNPDPTFFEQLTPKEAREALNLPGTAFTGLPLSIDASAGEVEFFAQLSEEPTATTTGNYLAISDDVYDNFYKEVGSASRIFVEAANNSVRFGNALWTAGLREAAAYDDCTGYPCVGGIPNGDIDLTADYRITAQVLDVPLAGGTLQIQIDNPTGTGANSVHGSDSRIAQIFGSDLAVGALVINVPGNITMNGATIGTVATRIGTATSFIAFRCPSNCGDAVDDGTGNLSGGINLSNIVIEYQ